MNRINSCHTLGLTLLFFNFIILSSCSLFSKKINETSFLFSPIKVFTSNYIVNVINDKVYIEDIEGDNVYQLLLENGKIIDTLRRSEVILRKCEVIFDTVALIGKIYEDHKFKIDIPPLYFVKAMFLCEKEAKYRGDKESFSLELISSDNEHMVLKFSRNYFYSIYDIVAFKNKYIIISFSPEYNRLDRLIAIIDLTKFL